MERIVTTKRPLGITFVSLWLFFVGLGGALSRFFPPPGGSAFLPRALELFVTANSILLIVASAGLWRMRPWSFHIFVVWIAVYVLTFTYAVVGPWRLMWVESFLAAIPTGLFLMIIGRYIRKTTHAL